MKLNDFAVVLKEIWNSMICQELWEPCDCLLGPLFLEYCPLAHMIEASGLMTY